MRSVYIYLAVGLTLTTILVLLVLSWRKKIDCSSFEEYFKAGIDHDTIYFQVIDNKHKLSSIHDSGLDPSLMETEFDLNIVKREYEGGIVKQLGPPLQIRYGRQIRNLDRVCNVSTNNIKDKGLYYIVTVKNGG